MPADGRLLRAATLESPSPPSPARACPSPRASSRSPSTHRSGIDRHGLHEHQCHPRVGRVRRHRDREGTEVGNISGAAVAGGDEVSTHPAAGQTNPADPVDRRRRPGRVDGVEPGAGRRVHRGVRRRGGVRDRRAAGEPAGGGHHDPGVRHPGVGQGRRDHETDAVDRDPRVDLGDQLRQDRDADPEPDDRGADGGGGPSVRDRGQRLPTGPDHPGGRATGGRLDEFLLPDGAWPPTP